MKRLTVVYFAALRETLGTAREQVEVPDSVRTVGELREWLALRSDPWAVALGPTQALRAAVDQRLVSADAQVHAGSEIAFFPPVTGG